MTVVQGAFMTRSGRTLTVVNASVANDTETEILSGGLNQNAQADVNFGQYGVNEVITHGAIFMGNDAENHVAWLEAPTGQVIIPLPTTNAGTYCGMPELCAPIRLMTGMSIKVLVTASGAAATAYLSAYGPQKSDIFKVDNVAAGGAGVEQQFTSVKTGQSIGNSLVGVTVTKMKCSAGTDPDAAVTALWPFAYVKSSEGYVKGAVGISQFVDGDGYNIQSKFSDVTIPIKQNDKAFITAP
tara:strand:+ start:160 stop:882 length:723 start_codon:yes stop_codon:yes gene_type:complete